MTVSGASQPVPLAKCRQQIADLLMHVSGRPDHEDFSHRKVSDGSGPALAVPKVGGDDALNQLHQFPAGVRDATSGLRSPLGLTRDRAWASLVA